MHVIYGNRRLIKKVKELLSSEGERYDETKFPEYLLVWHNPLLLLPPEMQLKLIIKECDNSNYFSILKNAGDLSDIFTPFIPESGKVVKIKSGTYKGLEAIVKEVKNRTCTVEFNILGRIAKETVSLDEVEGIE
jgi:hypothetical protein